LSLVVALLVAEAELRGREYGFGEKRKKWKKFSGFLGDGSTWFYLGVFFLNDLASFLDLNDF
jgi:hypothetical protein